MLQRHFKCRRKSQKSAKFHSSAKPHPKPQGLSSFKWTFELSQRKNFWYVKTYERPQICAGENSSRLSVVDRPATFSLISGFGESAANRLGRWNSNCKKPSCVWTKGSPRVTEKIAPGEKFYREKGGLGAMSCAVQKSELRSAAIKRSQHDSVAIYGEEIAALLQAR